MGLYFKIWGLLKLASSALAAAMTESEPIPQCQKGSLLSMQLGRRNGWVRKKHGKLQDKVSHSQIPTKMRRKETKEKKSADGPEIRGDTPGCTLADCQSVGISYSCCRRAIFPHLLEPSYTPTSPIARPHHRNRMRRPREPH